jgi:hypothetical protein
MRIFVLGDSFAENLFETGYKQLNVVDGNLGGEIKKYMSLLEENKIEKAKWFTDWLSDWGYEIYNFGVGGGTIEDLIYQFGKIDTEYKTGDRIIVNLTSINRFNWINEKRIQFIHTNYLNPYMDGYSKEECEFLLKQTVFRDELFKDKNSKFFNDINNFINYMLEKHSIYNPILWTIFAEFNESFQNNRWYYNVVFKNGIFNCNELPQVPFGINHETNGNIKDGHFGRYGNYYLALAFKEILESNTKEFYLKDEVLMKKINEKIYHASKNTIFKMPKEFRNQII